MRRHTPLPGLVLLLITGTSHADKTVTEAAIGGGAGGAIGGAIGAELGGRDGAIVGSAVGAAVGTAIATENDSQHHSRQPEISSHVSVRSHDHPQSTFCPPGQAKKGRC